MQELPYRRLVAWQRSYGFALEVLKMVEEPAFKNRFDLTRQMTRAAMSVPANIAEGHGRGTPLDFASFVDRARGSLFEIDNWLLMCRDRELISLERHHQLQTELLQVNALLWKLRESQRERAKVQRHRTT